MKTLRRILIRPEMAALLDRGVEAFERRYRVRVAADFERLRGVIAQTLALYADLGLPHEPWGGFLAVDPDTSTIVGTCAFKSTPSAEGEVEVAYFTFPEHEGQGFGTAMARRLIEQAQHAEGVRRVVARTLPERNASARILEKNGLRCQGVVHDPADGVIWRWELCLDAEG